MTFYEIVFYSNSLIGVDSDLEKFKETRFRDRGSFKLVARPFFVLLIIYQLDLLITILIIIKTNYTVTS